jgi:hypothetical protein
VILNFERFFFYVWQKKWHKKYPEKKASLQNT